MIRRPLAPVPMLLTLGRPHLGLLCACLASQPGKLRLRPRLNAAELARLARDRSRRALSILATLLLFSGAVLAARSLYLRGEPELAVLVVRKAHDETLRTSTRRCDGGAAFPARALSQLSIPRLRGL